jgi:hypothetical protein
MSESEVKKTNKKIKNWASDEEFAAQVRDKVLHTWRILKADREELERRWHEHYRMWAVTRDDNQSYSGRANLYMPQMRKEVETMTRRLVKALFPKDYMTAQANLFENEAEAKTNEFVVRHYFDNVMKLRNLAEPWLKQCVLYGTSPIKCYWDEKFVKQFVKTKKQVLQKNGTFEPQTSIEKKEVSLYCGPRASVRDMFNVWVSPQSATTPDEIQQVYEEYRVTLEDLRLKESLGAAIGIEDLKDLGREDYHEDSDAQENFATFGSSANLVGTSPYYKLLEVWTELDLPDGTRLPCVVEIVNEVHVIRIQQNPLWSQVPPYVFARFIIPPGGEFYGRGLPEAGKFLQHQLNDTINQGIDSATLSLNSIAIVDPAFAPNAESFEIEPNGIWWASPNAVKQFNFPDLSETAIKNANVIRSSLTELSDNSPQLPDPIAGKARSTGQATLAYNEWQTDMWNFMRKIESEALEPLAKMTHILLQQYIKEDVVIKIAGKYAGTWMNHIVSPEEIIGDYTFTWNGSIQTEDNAVKAQQLLQFMKVFGTVPPEVQSQVRLNWPNLAELFLTYGLGIKQADKILETKDLTPEVPPGIENKILELDGVIDVHEADNDDVHLLSHAAFKKTLKDDWQIRQMDVHIAKHQEQRDKKIMQAQMIQQQQQMMAAQAQGQGPGGRNNPMGNQGQINESMNESDMMRGMRM